MSKKRVDNETIVAELEKAHSLIGTERYKYVCNAIRHGTRPFSAAYALANWVNAHLKGSVAAEDWLARKAGVPAEHMGWGEMLQWRLRWIESMIEDARAGRVRIYVEE